MKIPTHPNYLISIGLVLLSFFAMILYAKDQSKAISFSRLTAYTMRDDLPSHRLRSTPTDSVHVNPRVNRMLTQLRDENYLGALKGVSQLIESQPSNVSLHYYAGCIAHRLGDLRTAKWHFQTVRMNSDLFYADALKKLAIIYYADRQHQLCRRMLEDLNPIAKGADLEWSQQLKKLL